LVRRKSTNNSRDQTPQLLQIMIY